MRLPIFRYFKVFIVLGALGFVASELVLRVMGVVDFPLYDANSTVGYIPAANQAGSFLNKNDFEFNEFHMGSGPFQPSDKTDILLIGDSLVYGGNKYASAERLGSQLQKTVEGNNASFSIWPISAGSWTLRNELAYINNNPAVTANIDWFVFVLNSGDFEGISSWRCEYTHPRKKPFSALWYVFNKYVYAIQPCGEFTPQLMPPSGELSDEVIQFVQQFGNRVTFVFYPDIVEMVDSSLEKTQFSSGEEILLNAGVNGIVRISDDVRWNRDLYWDGIHPSPLGVQVLSQIIYERVIAEIK